MGIEVITSPAGDAWTSAPTGSQTLDWKIERRRAPPRNLTESAATTYQTKANRRKAVMSQAARRRETLDSSDWRFQTTICHQALKAAAVARDICDKSKVDVVFTTLPPFSAASIDYKLKQERGHSEVGRQIATYGTGRTA